MFTGLMETLGEISRLDSRGPGGRPLFQTIGELTTELALGKSILVDGACLTVTHRSGSTFRVDAAVETLNCTPLVEGQSQQRIHLERALPSGARLGGHRVMGHVDSIGRLRKRQTRARL
jgi:riboflavin synthase